MTDAGPPTLAALVVVLLATGASDAGSLRAQLPPGHAVTSAQAIEYRPTKTGVDTVTHDGRVTGDAVEFADLPDSATLCLRLTTADGVVEGWDATVPASDYVEEQPLSDAGRAAIFEKLTAMEDRGFADEVRVLDVVGNIQHAAVLLERLRRRSFVGGGYQPGEWVWRVDRYQWHDPDEQAWTPDPALPWHALDRRRLRAPQHAALRIVYARHLGGIALSPQRPDVDLGLVTLPSVPPGVHACAPDGTIIEPVTLKPVKQGGG